MASGDTAGSVTAVVGEKLTAEEVADQMLLIVETEVSSITASPDLDLAGVLMFGAFRRAYSRFIYIRKLVREGAGEEAIILARSLVSLLARSGWVNTSEMPAEREIRYRRFAKTYLKERLAFLLALDEAGMQTNPEEISRVRADLDSLVTAKELPPDRQLLEELGLQVFHAWIYRLGSEYAHFSLGAALGEAIAVDEIGRREEELATVALSVAILCYGAFLESSQKALGHDFGTRAWELVEASNVGDWVSESVTPHRPKEPLGEDSAAS